MLGPRTEYLIFHVKGWEGDLELVPKEQNKLFVRRLNVVTVMMNTETWLPQMELVLCGTLSQYLCI